MNEQAIQELIQNLKVHFKSSAIVTNLVRASSMLKDEKLKLTITVVVMRHDIKRNCSER